MELPSSSDLHRLSNNLGRSRVAVGPDADAPYRRLLAAVNRSLARVGERVSSLHSVTAKAGGRPTSR